MLIERGANVNVASTAGVTPLYATINAQWAPKSRYPQPQAVQNQKTDYLELMEALLEEGRESERAAHEAAVVLRVQQLRQRELRSREHRRHDGVLARGVLARRRRDEAAGRVRRRSEASRRSARRRRRAWRSAVAAAARGGLGAAARLAVAVVAAVAVRSLAPPLDPAIDSAAKAAPVGIGVFPIHAAAGVGYGNGFAGNSHRHAPDGWMPAMKYLVEELHADVNARDNTGYTPLHHAAARGDNEMILYLVAHGADVKAVSRNGRTTVDMANGPVQRLSPIPETIALLEKLGAKNQHHCVSC